MAVRIPFEITEATTVRKVMSRKFTTYDFMHG